MLILFFRTSKWCISSLLITVISIIGITKTKAQTFNNFEERVSSVMRNYNLVSPAEKVYIHTDRTIYSSGQKIYYNVYLIHASTLTTSQLSKIAYVELFDQNGSLIAHTIQYFEDGTSSGEIELPQNLVAGEYVIKGYTAYMKNFDESFYFRKSIRIVNPYKEDVNAEVNSNLANTNIDVAISSPDIQFFPEGGSFIANSYSKIAYKGIDPLGYGFQYDGEIQDQNGNILQKFESNKLGMGSVLFTPEEGKKYTAIVTYQGYKYVYPLPEVKSEGYSLRASTINGTVNIIGKYFGQDNSKEFAVLIHNRGTQLAYGISQNNSFFTRLGSDHLPEGLITISLIDSEGIIKCERLVYVYKEDNPSINIIHDPTITGKRKKVHVKLKMDDTLKSDSIKMSMSIARPIYYLGNNEELTIRNYLLLTSELKGHIENPGYYFDITNSNRSNDMDALLLTQGWREYEVTPISDEEIILPEESLNISGQLVNYYSKKGMEGEISLHILEKGLYDVRTETDENGHFKFDEVVFFGKESLIIEGSKKRKNARKQDSKDPVTVLLDSINKPTTFDQYDVEFTKPEFNQFHNYNNVVKKINKIDSAYFVKNKIIILDAVEIVEDKKDPLTDGRQIPYGSPSYRLNVDSLQSAGSLFVLDLFRRLRSVQLRGNAPNYTVTIRGGLISMSGQVEPLLLLDGTPVTLDFLQNMPADNVQFIDVLTGMQATTYGSRGAGGVIAIYTKSGSTGYFSDERVDWGIVSVKMKGAQSPTSFYSPKFEVDLNNQAKPMYFNTLYWNPSITLQKGEMNDIYFYSSDESANYKIRLEGLSSDGVPIYKESFITVE